jgi:hypothetical protein
VINWGSTWDFLWHFVIIFARIAYLLVLFQILTALVYLFARGKGMTERAREAAAAAQKQTDDYIKQAAGRSPAQEIATAG